MRKLLGPALVGCVVLAWVVFARAGGEDPAALVAKAIKAAGDEKNVARTRTVQSSAKGTLFIAGQEIPITTETTLALPDKLRMVMTLKVNNMEVPVTTVANGNKAWVQAQGQTKELTGAELEEVRQGLNMGNAASLLPLRDKTYKLSALGEAKVDGKDCVGITAARKGFRDVNLYFDKASGLIRKIEFRTLDPVSKQEVTQERILRDYKTFDGIKSPTRLLVNNDGKRLLEMEVTEMRFLDQVDQGQFTKP